MELIIIMSYLSRQISLRNNYIIEKLWLLSKFLYEDVGGKHNVICSDIINLEYK